MFKHILLPTDGSPASEAAVRAALSLAAETGAKITAVHVLPDAHVFSYAPEIEDAARQVFARDGTTHADKLLADVAEASAARGIGCDCVLARGDRPHRKILETALARRCDLIATASWG
ncbi:universal stress protein [Pseudoduganella sp. LjRoot289]|uniref:universal stress protein n=1 Tax=Pseudoduganella sp. LjRoot289 TaxID=3342314 RepID=UPI003ED0FD06